MKSFVRLHSGFLALLILAAAASAQPALDQRWTDLASADETTALRALLALSATPKETTAFLNEHLKPVKPDTKRIAQLIKQLDSTNFAARNQAMKELEYFGKYIKADLEAALKADPAVERKTRIQQLIEKMPRDKKDEPMPKMVPNARPGSSVSVSNVNGKITILIDGQPLDFSKMTPPPPPPGPPQSWVRAVRAVTILEHLGTAEARQILDSMAAGEADALPTVAARAALDRLKK
jgi:hypothetical protein